MRYSRPAIVVAILVCLFAKSATSPAAQPGAPTYKITKNVPLGAPDGWDSLYFEPQSHRVYVAHSTEITVAESGASSGRMVRW